VFDTLAHEENKFDEDRAKKIGREAPSFGNSETPYEEVRDKS